jgi:hypothetical protein
MLENITPAEQIRVELREAKNALLAIKSQYGVGSREVADAEAKVTEIQGRLPKPLDAPRPV